MSDQNSDPTSYEKMRTRNRGKPSANKDRVRAYRARKRETHKVIKLYIKPEIKETLVRLCENQGITQSEILERLILAADR